MEITCFVITGKLNQDTTAIVVQSFQSVKNKIVSTWDSEEPAYLHVLRAHGFTLILSKLPDTPSSLNCQALSISNGVKAAQSMGFTHCIRVRTDMFCNNYPLLQNAMLHIMNDSNKLYCLSGLNGGNDNGPFVYFICEFMCGTTQKLLEVFDIQDSTSRVPEMVLLETYFKKDIITKDDIRSLFTFCGKELQRLPLSIEWYGKGWDLLFYCQEHRSHVWY